MSAAVLLWAGLVSAGLAQTPPPAEQPALTPPPAQSVRSSVQPPLYKPLRYDEDWSFLRDPARRHDLWDSVKYIPLDAQGTASLSFGGEAREPYEYYRNVSFGKGIQDKDGYTLQRYLLSMDAHWNSHVRLFTQLDASAEDGRKGGPRPNDRNAADLQQAFLDLGIDLARSARLTVRAGRQEMVFGSGRLVNASEGSNVRARFDGVRAFWKSRSWRIDGFVTRPSGVRPGAFDDGTDYTRLFWGIYAAGPLPALPGGGIDLYYFDLDSRREAYVQGTAREVRRTVGTRLYGGRRAWDYNGEFSYQFGRFGVGDVRAFGLDTDTGYTAHGWRFTPRFGLRANVTSGDRNPGDADLQTFNPLYPALNYYNLSGDAGPRNIADLHPTIDLHLTRSVTFSADWNFFWRESLQDGLYGPSRGVLVAPAGSRAKYNGSQPQAQCLWVVDRHLTALLNYTHAQPGPFLSQNNARSLDYFTSYVTYKF